MLSSVVSRFGSAKGMVTVPDLSGLTKDQAIDALKNSGLNFRNSTTSTTSNSSSDNKAFSQSISGGILVDYETEIDFEYYVYVYVPPAQPPETFSPFGNCGDQTTSQTYSGCNGSLYYEYVIESYYQLYVGNRGSSYWSYCGQQKYGSSTGSTVAGKCGVASFVPWCTTWGSYGACQPGGYKERTRTCYSYAGDPGTTDYSIASCSCTPTTTYSSWGTCKNKQQWRNVYWKNSDCTTGSYSQVRAC